MSHILTIDYPIDSQGVTQIQITGRETLLDADILIIDPSKFSRLWSKAFTLKNGRGPLLSSEDGSDRARELLSWRREEIDILLNRGKVVIIFLSAVNSVLGEDNYTNIYEQRISNYDFLPPELSNLLKRSLVGAKSTGGEGIKLRNPNNAFSQYFKAFKDELCYTAYLDIDTDDNEYFLVNRSDKPVGFTTKVHNGIVSFLPRLEYENPSHKLVAVLLDCCKSHLTKSVRTPAPPWIDDYALQGEDALNSKIIDYHNRIKGLLASKNEAQVEKDELLKFKLLLYGQGDSLVEATIKAFKLFGFEAETRKLNDLEHDIIFSSEEGKGLAEVEGKDNDSVHIDKLDQLNRAVDEDFNLRGSYPAGILVGNHFRFTKPELRKEPFTEKVHKVAQKKDFGLLTTFEIYRAVEYILKNPTDELFKKQCRTKILTQTGEEITLFQS